MLAVVDRNFRRGLGLMLTGLWVTFFGLVWVAFGLLGAIVGIIIIIVGGMILAYGFDVMNRMPPAGVAPPPAP